ncbi:MAG: hypothetical protein PHP88_09115 [bacterium]|nr:hypothetical protein [bacterium]
MTLRRTALWCGAGLTALLGVATLAVTLAVYRPQLVRPWVERALAPRGGTASLSGIEVSLAPPVLALSGLSIAASPSGGGDLLRADHLRFELIPGRFFRGGPWLRHVEARGVNFERPRPRETEGPPDLSPLTRLFDIEDLSLTGARLRVAVPQGVLAVDGLRLSLAPGEAGVRAFSGSADLSFRAKGSPVFAAKLSARGTVTPEPALTVDLESASGRLELPWITGNLSGRTRLRLTRKNFRVEDLVLTLPQGRVNTGPRAAILPERIRLNAAGGATLDGREPSLEIRELDIGGLLIARGRLSGPTIDKISGTLDGEIPRVERARTYWAPLLPGALADVELTGRLPWRLTLSTRRVAATAKLVQIGFRSPNGDAIGQNLDGTVDIEAYLTSRPRVKADLALRRGEALWGTVYLDLAKNPLDLRVGGTRAGPGKYEELLIEGGLAGFGRLGIDGKARREGERWRHEGRLALRDARLGPIFRTFLRDPLAASQPDLVGLEMEGAASVDLSFSGSGKAVDLDGTLRLRLSDLHRGAEPPLLSGLDIDLPVSYSMGAANPGRPRPSDAARWGRLRLEKARLAGQELGPLEIPAVLVPNRLYLGGTVEASLFGAKLALRRIEVDDPISPAFQLNMAARLDGLDLARVAGKNPLLEGHLGGLLDPVTIGRERMTAAGELTGDLFGGRLDVRRVTVERPFSAGREIGADMNVDRIDLDRFSAALGFGRITGRLSGSINGLRVAYGQPVAFDLKMESVPVKGVSQSVSLKAVNSISLVSTGSALSGAGASLMATFFREFAYEKIGFKCGLKNDVFTVRGLIHEAGVEYLVKRRLFTGIDVINGNPDNRIGFSDMLERAKRVTEERPD